MQHNNIVSFDKTATSQRIALSEKSSQTVNKCRLLVVKMLPPLITSLFEKLDDSLFELSEKSESDVQQASYFDAMRELRKERAHIEKQFKKKICIEYDRFWSHGPDNREADKQDNDGLPAVLSLLEEDALEEFLALTNLVSKGENRYQRELEALNERFSHIIDGAEVTHQSNPVSPYIISNQFHELLHPVLVDLPVKLVIYKLFDKFVMHYMGSIYDELNLLLGKQGVLPKLTPKVRRNPVAPAIRKERHAQSAHPVTDQSADIETQAEVFNTIQSLLGQRDTGGMVALGAPISGATLPAVETVELLNTLSSLQTTNITLVAHVQLGKGQQNLRQTLVNTLQMESNGELNKTLSKADSDTIDAVSMLFRYILDDRNLPDPMKALIGRLQIPMLKIALADKSFFSKKVHPARQLLNSVARAAVGWSDDGDRSSQSLYGVVEGMVKRILDEFEQDAGLFDQLNEEFSTFFAREERGAEVAEERTNQVVRGKEQLKIAKILVSNIINSRLGVRRQVPEVVHTLLSDGWKDMLLLIHLRQGVESDAWARGLEVMDTLLWSIEPKSESAERKELLTKIPNLLHALREGLTEISYDQHKMARQFKELQRCHILCMKGRMETVKMVATEPVEGMAPGDRTQSPQSDHLIRNTAEEIVLDSSISPHSREVDATIDLQPPQHDEFHDHVNAIKVGTWIEITEDNEKIRIKLSWKSNVTDTFIFVNRKGAKVKEMTAETFATMLRAREASILKDAGEPLMDRALNAMMAALKKTVMSTATG